MKIAPNFNRLAGVYRWMEWVTFGPWLGWCRCAHLHAMNSRRKTLVIGDGDGRFTAKLLRANAKVEVDAVDVSGAMLQGLLRRAGCDADRVRPFCIDARLWQPTDEHYDLIITHFFLDCLTTQEIHALATQLRGAVGGSALWVISEFAVPRDWFGRWVAGPIVQGLYCVFGLLTGLTLRTLPDYAAALQDAGFARQEQRYWLRGLLVSELWATNGIR